ncbi:MAG: hypothetical protein ABL927_02480, partial [Bdellovibrionales bacterium]
MFFCFSAWALHPHVEKTDYRGSFKPLEISIDKSSPAYFALEDTQNQTKYNQQPTLTIVANSNENQNNLEVLKISKRMKLQNSNIKRMSWASLTMSESKKDEIQLQIRALPALVVDQNISEKNPDSRHIVIANNIQPDVERSDFSSFQELGNKLVRDELERQKRSPSKNNGKFASNDSKNEFAKKNSIFTVTENNKDLKKYIITGALTLKDGAGFMYGQDIIKTRHILDGLNMSEGFVRQAEGSYEISVDQLDGDLVAEITNVEGQTIAQGRLNLKTLNQKYLNIARIEKIPIDIRPVFNGARIQLISAASYDKKTFLIEDAKLFIPDLNREVSRNLKSGYYEDDTIVMPSNYIVKAQKENFWPTLAQHQSGHDQQIRLFPKSLVEALLNLSLPKYEARDAESKAVIWGRVSFGPNAIEGAKISVIGEEKLKAVYFSGFLPDKTRKTTSYRGEFAFTNVTNGEKLIKVEVGEKSFWPTMISAAEKHVTYADLEVQTQRLVDFKSYSAFSMKPIETMIIPMGELSDSALDIGDSGVLRTEVDTLKGISFVESVPKTNLFERVRSTLTSEQSEVLLPQIESKWLENITKQANPQISNFTKPCIG